MAKVWLFFNKLNQKLLYDSANSTAIYTTPTPRSTPAPGKQLLRKDLQEPLFAQAGKRSSQEARQGDSCREKEALLSLEEQATRMYDT